MVEVRFACMPSVEGVRCSLDGEVKYSDALGLCSFFGVSQGEHSYGVEAGGMYVASGEDAFGRPLGAGGTTVIEWALVPGTPWPEDQPWMMYFNFEVGEAPVARELLGKVGAVLASIGFVGVLFGSARRR